MMPSQCKYVLLVTAERAPSWKRGRIPSQCMCQLQREGKTHTEQMKKRDTNTNQNQIGSAHLQHYPWHIPGPLVQRSTSAGEEEVGSYTQLHAKELARVTKSKKFKHSSTGKCQNQCYLYSLSYTILYKCVTSVPLVL